MLNSKVKGAKRMIHCKSMRRREGYSKKAVLFLLSALFLFSQSCVYYNTFYNAKKYFESAQSYDVPETGRPPARAIQDYDRVIERCTYILREHPDSKWADDALYLLGRSLYYQRRNMIQAKDRFQDMLRVFPDSKYIPSSKIYAAKVEYQLANRSEAFFILQDVLDNDDYREYHPQVLLLRSEWNLAEGNPADAQRDLSIIVQDYPRSDEYEEAFLKLGMSYLKSEQYEDSKKLFEDLLASRVARRIRFDARYYIALSNFYLGNYNKVMEQLDSLQRDEYEQELFPRIYVLRARTHVAMGNYETAEELFNNVITDNRRTIIAAEASFYLAEMYFRHLGKHDMALESYNQVSRQSRSSPYVDKAMSRSSVVSQVIQLRSTEHSLGTRELVQEHFRLAEYYLYEMNLPDSALSVYKSIDNQTGRLKQRLETVEQFLSDNQDLVDSLEVAGKEEDTPQEIETLEQELEYTEEDEIVEYEENDIQLEDQYSEVDSLLIKLQEKINEKQTLKEAIKLYKIEFVPYSYFLTAWVLYKELDSSDESRQYLDKLREQYPDSRYYYATKQLLDGEQVSLTHPVEKEKEKKYEAAVKLLESQPYEALTKLKELKNDIENRISHTPEYYPQLLSLREKVIYTIGFTYYFDINDSTNARDYFDTILSETPQSAYGETVSQFYSGEHFIVTDSLPDPPKEEVDEEVDGEREEVDTEINEEHPEPIEEFDPDAVTPWEPDYPDGYYPGTTPEE